MRRSFSVVRLMSRGDHRVNPPADVEIGNQLHRPWLARPDQIVQDTIRDRFVKMAFVPERPEVELERFQLNAQPVRHISQGEGCEVGLASPRAEAGKVGGGDLDLVVTPGFGVGNGFDLSRWLRRHGALFPLRYTAFSERACNPEPDTFERILPQS